MTVSLDAYVVEKGVSSMIDWTTSLITVGAFLFYKGKLVMMIGPDQTGDRLGIVRLGGHIEAGENALEALNRELLEEASIRAELINAPKNYFCGSWGEEYYETVLDSPYKVKPLIVRGNEVRSTAVFLAKTQRLPKPSSEACGLIFLDEKDIQEICSKTLCLNDFLNGGGMLLLQKELDAKLALNAGVHLRFIHNLSKTNPVLVHSLFQN